jgi:putative ABC transport system ATP-binding protein
METSNPLFALDQVTVQRGNAVLLDAVSCEIPQGACTALVGPSGAGKSTLLRLLNRLGEPTGGTVRFGGEPLPALDVLELRRRVGLVGQQPILLTDDVLADLRVGAPDLDVDHAATLLKRVNLPPDMLNRETAGLSGGEAQRVCLARALAVDPEALLLDEPTSALDPASAEVVETTIRDLVDNGLSVVLVSHNAAQARRVADHALVLEAGRLIATGPPEHVDYLREDT